MLARLALALAVSLPLAACSGIGIEDNSDKVQIKQRLPSR